MTVQIIIAGVKILKNSREMLPPSLPLVSDQQIKQQMDEVPVGLPRLCGQGAELASRARLPQELICCS